MQRGEVTLNLETNIHIVHRIIIVGIVNITDSRISIFRGNGDILIINCSNTKGQSPRKPETPEHLG
jgi:hypothetical protein